MAANGFTEESWEAEYADLKEKCKIIADADPSQVFSESCMKRLLKAFHTSNQAFTALQKSQKWRREYGVEKLSEDQDVLNEMITRKAVLLRQRDMKGRPILYICAKRHHASQSDIDKVTKFIVHMLECACKRCDETVIDNLCIVFDMKDFTSSNMDYQFVKNLIWLLSKHYPERLGTCLIINSPIVFYSCWSVIKPWLHEVTAKKVIFVSDETALCQYLNPDFLPSD